MWGPVGIVSTGCYLAFLWDLVVLTSCPPQSLLKLRDLSTTQLCSYLDVPTEDFTNQIALVARGNCTFYEKVRLAQGSGALGLVIVSKERLVGRRSPSDTSGVVVKGRGALDPTW